MRAVGVRDFHASLSNRQLMTGENSGPEVVVLSGVSIWSNTEISSSLSVQQTGFICFVFASALKCSDNLPCLSLCLELRLRWNVLGCVSIFLSSISSGYNLVRSPLAQFARCDY